MNKIFFLICSERLFLSVYQNFQSFTPFRPFFRNSCVFDNYENHPKSIKIVVFTARKSNFQIARIFLHPIYLTLLINLFTSARYDTFTRTFLISLQTTLRPFEIRLSLSLHNTKANFLLKVLLCIQNPRMPRFR